MVGEVATPVVALRGVSKTFGGSHALRDVGLSVLPGEVHGLLGENGSGKSTLIKVLSGFHAPDPGAVMEVDGEPVALPLAPGAFRALGFGFVHQDLGLVPGISVLENLRVGELIVEGRGWISWRSERRRAARLFERFGLELDPRAQVAELPDTERALLAIVRAVEEIDRARHGRPGARGLLVLDEPTVFLPRDGVDRLFAIVRAIVADGRVGVLFVSHDLDEVAAITDRVTVLRDGRVQGTVPTAQTSSERMVELIVGRALGALEAKERPAAAADAAAVTVRDLTGAVVDDLAFDLHGGEILGVTGLMGSGYDEVPYLLFGARPCRRGHLRTAALDADLRRLDPRGALAAGICLVPGDRLRDGCVPTLPVDENLALPMLGRVAGERIVRRRRVRERAAALVAEYDVRPADPGAPYDALSGGNQQKALLAKWLQTGPSLLLLHEPTQGVDIGARAQIFRLLDQVAAGGTAVVLASNDHEQLAAVCDRVLVLARGRVADELTGADLTKERIAERVLGATASTCTTLESTS